MALEKGAVGMSLQRPATALAPVYDEGGHELGFRNKPSRRRDFFKGIQRPTSAHFVETSHHNFELPLATSLAPTRPTRHSPWKSEAERVMIAAETSLSRSATRGVMPSGVGPNLSFTKNRSASFPVQGELNGTAKLMQVSPLRVGRPGNRSMGLMSSSSAKLYASMAQSAVGDRRSFGESLSGGGGASTLASSSATSLTIDAGFPEASSPILPVESSPMLASESEATSRPRSPYARYELIPTQFANGVAQDLWSEVHKGSMTGTPPIRNEKYLSEAGLPRRLPSSISALESACRDAPSMSSPSRFAHQVAVGAAQRATAEGRARVMRPELSEPSRPSSPSFPASQGKASDRVSPRSANSTTYTASHYDSVLASEAPPSTPFSSVASLARGGSAPLPGTVFYPDHNSEDGNEGQVGDDNIDNASVSSKYTLGTRPPSELANFGSRSGISRGLFTGPRASAQSTRRDGHSHAHSHASPDARFHAEKFYQVTHMDDDYSRLRTPDAFFRVSSPVDRK